MSQWAEIRHMHLVDGVPKKDLWKRQIGSSGKDEAFAATPDGSGGAYLSGRTDGSLSGPSAGYQDAWLARYDAVRNELWIRQIGTNAYDGVKASALGDSGEVYLSGQTGGSLGGPNVGSFDAWLASFDGAGNQLWIQQLGTSDWDLPTSAAMDGAGGVYLGGATSGNFGVLNESSPGAWLARYGGSCGVDSIYCTASSTSIPGCQASIGASGSPSVADPTGFTISSGSVPGRNLGICFLGNNGAASIPFGTLGGKVCVQPPVYRSTAKPSGGSQGNCSGNYSFTLQDLINASPIVVSGAAINAEIWARDPANPDGFLLSNGLSFTVCP